ncbi:hypothetical protein OHJ21_28305 [Virgibacillus sp. LDC1]|uniref:hypothetical protein n=1 Tax=Paenibacillus sp. 843 TaxID=3341795 RepID=UPI00372D7AC4|nr:hypothetical protein [Virgibacillus sp. LDC1]
MKKKELPENIWIKMKELSESGEFFSLSTDPLIHFMNNIKNAVMSAGLHKTLKALFLSFPQA